MGGIVARRPNQRRIAHMKSVETEQAQAVSMEPGRRSWGSAEMQAEREALDRAAQKALEQRRAEGEIMTYHLDGWMVREFPGMRIERLCPLEEFRADDFPYPGFKEPTSVR